MFDLHAINSIDLARYTSNRYKELDPHGKYWSGPCPLCKDGDDRFVVKQRHDGEYRWFCRVCGDGKYHTIIDLVMQLDNVDFQNACSIITGDDVKKATPEQLAAYARAREEENARRMEELRRLTEKYSTEEIWMLFVGRMNEDNRQWWRDNGIPDGWQEFWRLGYTPDRPFEWKGELYHSPAYTIPKFDYGFAFKNIDFRLLSFPERAGKYRPAAELAPASFLSRPDVETITDEVLIVEGSKKAMVATVYSGMDIDKVHIYGIPSKNSWAGIVERVKPCGRVWVALDPDATDWACKLAGEIGGNARIVEMPFKPDDGFLLYGLTTKGWRELLKYARIPTGAKKK